MNLLYFLFVIFILSWFPIEILDVESDGFVIYKIFCFDFQNGIYIFDRVIQKMVNLLYFLFVIYLIVILNRNLGCRISDEFVVYRIFYFDFQSRIYIYIYLAEIYLKMVNLLYFVIFILSWFAIEILTCAISNVIAPMLNVSYSEFLHLHKFT